MQIGLIGFEGTALNLAIDLQTQGHDVIVYDHDELTLQTIQEQGITIATSLKTFSESMISKRVIWITVPVGELLDQILVILKGYLSVSDIIIDSSDSFYKDTIRRSRELRDYQIDYLDCSILYNGHDASFKPRFVIGGNRFALNYCEPVLTDIASPDSCLYCGRSGSGHFVGMVARAVQAGTITDLQEGLSAHHNDEFTLDNEKIARFLNI
jgi:6-phosphogluconate dehydrogenase